MEAGDASLWWQVAGGEEFQYLIVFQGDRNFWIRAMMLESLQKLYPIYLPPQAKKDLKAIFKYLPADEETTVYLK